MKTNSILIIVLAVALGGIAGWYVPHSSNAHAPVTTPARKILYYACPMHPTIKYDKPGNCPICGMALQPVYAGETTTNASAGCCSGGGTL
jgi:Cu(I)/Ag(I) efflux system membrane fusion protein